MNSSQLDTQKTGPKNQLNFFFKNRPKNLDPTKPSPKPPKQASPAKSHNCLVIRLTCPYKLDCRKKSFFKEIGLV